jgi:aspartyl-tRNA(Asn)/glutamyl-tRNA(Gln) amidotransferase subunit C
MIADAMTQLTKDQVRHIAKLARLRLTDEEIEKLPHELTNILGYIDMLKEVDTTGVEPTAQVTGMMNSFRDDVVQPQITAPEALLQTSPLPIVERQIQTPSAHA